VVLLLQHVYPLLRECGSMFTGLLHSNVHYFLLCYTAFRHHGTVSSNVSLDHPVLDHCTCLCPLNFNFNAILVPSVFWVNSLICCHHKQTYQSLKIICCLILVVTNKKGIQYLMLPIITLIFFFPFRNLHSQHLCSIAYFTTN
jgi:hypothetical protein